MQTPITHQYPVFLRDKYKVADWSEQFKLFVEILGNETLLSFSTEDVFVT